MPARRLPLAIVLVAAAIASVDAEQQRAPALRIVVIQGEDAVNIVQQRTAVGPIIEVRDRNDLPVAGATVSFTIGSKTAAFAGGSQTLTITTDAAGRAAVAAMTPTGAGAVQINVAAAFQGQTATATIVQTNVATAAQAAAASGTASASSAGGGTAAGGAAGGGLSTTTLGIVAGAAAAGTVVAVRELQGGTTYLGSYSGVMVWRTGPNQPCSNQSRISATVIIELTVADNEVSGTARTSSSRDSRIENVSSTCPDPPPFGVVSDYGWSGDPIVTGTTGSLRFRGELGQNLAINWIWDFVGSLNGNVIAGTLTHTWVRVSDGFVQGTTHTPITLTQQ